MEKTDLCARCSCLPVCEVFRAIGPTDKCEHYCHHKDSGRWILKKGGWGICSKCNFSQSHVWDYDSFQAYCGVCGAKMSLEELE